MIFKVCGMKYSENMAALPDTGCNLMGMIFYDRSPRFFQGSVNDLPENMKRAGVFVNSSVADIINKTRTYGLNWIQLHGEEEPEFCLELRSALRSGQLDAGIIKAIPVREKSDLKKAALYEGRVQLFLFDTMGKNRGGNGVQFNWEILKYFQSPTPFLLSGGIGPQDADKVNSFLRSPAGENCAGIDLNSRFESKPGEKNTALIKQFNSQITRKGLEQTPH